MIDPSHVCVIVMNTNGLQFIMSKTWGAIHHSVLMFGAKHENFSLVFPFWHINGSSSHPAGLTGFLPFSLGKSTSGIHVFWKGFLFFEGRADNLIKCGGQKISAEHIEEQLALRLKIPKGFAITRAADNVYGEAVLLCVENSLQDRLDELKSVAQAIMAEGGISASGALKVYNCDQLPTTDTGKIQRKQLIQDYQAQAPSDATTEQVDDEANASPKERLVNAFCRCLNIDTVDEHDTLDKFGLDSITVVGISIAIEKILGDLPPNWRELNINQLAKIAELNPDLLKVRSV